MLCCVLGGRGRCCSRGRQRRRGCKLKAADVSLPSWWPPRPATFSLLHALRLGEISELPELGTLSLQAYDSQDEFFFMYVELIVSTTSTICNIDILFDHISTSYNLQIAFRCLSGTFFSKSHYFPLRIDIFFTHFKKLSNFFFGYFWL